MKGSTLIWSILSIFLFGYIIIPIINNSENCIFIYTIIYLLLSLLGWVSILCELGEKDKYLKVINNFKSPINWTKSDNLAYDKKHYNKEITDYLLYINPIFLTRMFFKYTNMFFDKYFSINL